CVSDFQKMTGWMAVLGRPFDIGKMAVERLYAFTRRKIATESPYNFLQICAQMALLNLPVDRADFHDRVHTYLWNVRTDPSDGHFIDYACNMRLTGCDPGLTDADWQRMRKYFCEQKHTKFL